MPYTLSYPGSILGKQLTFARRETAVEWRTGDYVDYVVAFEITESERIEWRNRESRRLQTGEYIALPWMRDDDDDARNHTLRARITETENRLSLFSHLSIKHPGQIAFTMSEEHGYLDRQTTMRPGKYLQKYYPDMLTAAERDKFIGAVTVKTTLPKVNIARTRKAVRDVYNHIPSDGLTSCMQRKSSPHYDWQRAFDDGSLPFHPVEVYGDSDLGVAYLGPITNIIARCVVWPDRMLFSRIYGDHGHDRELQSVLESLGYSKGSMAGATVAHITHNDRVIMPYLDGIEHAEVRSNKHIRLGSGDLGTQELDGYAKVDDDDTDDCPDCGDTTDQSELDDHGGYCRSCDENNTCCTGCDRRISCDDANNTDDGSYCDRCYRDMSTLCAIDDCRERWIEDELTSRLRRDRADRGVTALCVDCGNRHEYCSECDDYYSNRDSSCPDCAPEVDDDDDDATDTDTASAADETAEDTADAAHDRAMTAIVATLNADTDTESTS